MPFALALFFLRLDYDIFAISMSQERAAKHFQQEMARIERIV
jgi:hypothetical protein